MVLSSSKMVSTTEAQRHRDTETPSFIFRLAQIQRPDTVAELVGRRAVMDQNSKHELFHRRLVWEREMPAGLQLPAEFPGEQTRQIEMAVQIAVAHSASVENQAMVEQRPFTVTSGLQPAEKIAEQL